VSRRVPRSVGFAAFWPGSGHEVALGNALGQRTTACFGGTSTRRELQAASLRTELIQTQGASRVTSRRTPAVFDGHGRRTLVSGYRWKVALQS
jgi:hypothetical protein